ncbi:uncharacterized protein RSE6_09230 [Rhynchosporium secalis]|uniref:DUF7779 domain-containing protein n=1 Tax=Rhynchosporium secalis TaxID=38038 RepID=A0A1E1MHE1_RHYSE|nr:uncharacterized protein RSE6_09230 [Rhynchosporium secalis]
MPDPNHKQVSSKHIPGRLRALDTLLQAEYGSREEIAVLGVIAFLNPENIGEDILKPDITQPQAPDYPINESNFQKACKNLISSSIVWTGPAQSSLNVGPEVQKRVRDKIAEDAIRSKSFFIHVATRLASLWPYTNETPVPHTQGKKDRWRRCAMLRPHVESLIEGYFDLKLKRHVAQPTIKFVELLKEAASYHIERGEPEEATRLLDIAAPMCESAKATPRLTEYRPEIYRGFVGLAHITRERRLYLKYAELNFNVELERFKESGKETASLASAYDHTGIVYSLFSRHEDAIRCFETSIAIRRNLEDFRKDWLFIPKYHTAHVYLHLGDDERAAGILDSAIIDRVEVHGEYDRYSHRTGILCYTLGDIRKHQGRLRESFALHSRAYDNFRSTEGPTNLGTLHCKYKVATHLARINDYNTARKFLDEILTHYRITPHARPYICRTAFLYADCLQEEGKDFSKMLQEALKVFNEYSPYKRNTMGSLTEKDAASVVSYDYL